MSRNLCRTFFTASRFLHKDFVSKVPGMGDSITEGSLIKLVAKLGALVKQDEIVAVIETDKVRGVGQPGRRWGSAWAVVQVYSLAPCLAPSLTPNNFLYTHTHTQHQPHHTR